VEHLVVIHHKAPGFALIFMSSVKKFSRTNTLTYLSRMSMTNKKIFWTNTPGVNLLKLFSSPQTVAQAKLYFFVYDGPYQPTLIFVSKAAANRVQIFIRSETRLKRLSRESKRSFFSAIYSNIGAALIH
jgi:hypothetical protein